MKSAVESVIDEPKYPGTFLNQKIKLKPAKLLIV